MLYGDCRYTILLTSEQTQLRLWPLLLSISFISDELLYTRAAMISQLIKEN